MTLEGRGDSWLINGTSLSPSLSLPPPRWPGASSPSSDGLTVLAAEDTQITALEVQVVDAHGNTVEVSAHHWVALRVHQRSSVTP